MLSMTNRTCRQAKIKPHATFLTVMPAFSSLSSPLRAHNSFLCLLSSLSHSPVLTPNHSQKPPCQNTHRFHPFILLTPSPHPTPTHSWHATLPPHPLSMPPPTPDLLPSLLALVTRNPFLLLMFPPPLPTPIFTTHVPWFRVFLLHNVNFQQNICLTRTQCQSFTTHVPFLLLMFRAFVFFYYITLISDKTYVSFAKSTA